MSLLHCKAHCLHSQTGVYSCRSFVYDNMNQVGQHSGVRRSPSWLKGTINPFRSRCATYSHMSAIRRRLVC